MSIRWRWTSALVLFVTSSAFACRYTVREIGFVNLEGTPWTIVHLSSEPDLRAPDLPDDVNAQSVVIDPLADPNHPAVKAANGSTNAVLVGPNGRTLLLQSANPTREAIQSPLRQRMATEALETFAFLLVKLGTNESENDHARRVAAGAKAKLNALAPHLPRPVSHPLRVIELSTDESEAERVLLWSLGVDQTDDAAIVIVYGRGRRAGPPITGAFDEVELTTQLALVGESCECETDRAWLKEPTAPMRWPESSAYAAPESLGFDPESPMVQAEVRRILARGDFGVGRGANADGNRPKDLSEIVFGYTEVTLEERLPEPRPDAPSTVPTPPETVVDIRRDDGWGFDAALPTEPATPTEVSSSTLPLILTSATIGIVGLFAAIIIIRR